VSSFWGQLYFDSFYHNYPARFWLRAFAELRPERMHRAGDMSPLATAIHREPARKTTPIATAWQLYTRRKSSEQCFSHSPQVFYEC
ncbi:hypothetical protein CPAR01_15367, partial [Colletotrichum paranaense]